MHQSASISIQNWWRDSRAELNISLLIVSVTVQEICECFLILCFGFEGTGTDSTGELTLRSGSGGQIAPLGEDLLSVRVGNVGFDHAHSVARIGGNLKRPCATSPTGWAAALGIKNSRTVSVTNLRTFHRREY